MNITLFSKLANDKDTRVEAENNPIEFARNLGLIVNEDTKVIVVKNTSDIFYVVLDAKQSQGLSLENLGDLNAADGDTRATASTLFSCVGCFG